MSYATLGTSCLPITCALTSNEKFLLPNNPDYSKPYTNMFEYPGHNDHVDSIGHIDALHPEHIKAYYSKDTSPRDIPIPDTMTNQCKKCG